jgi:hypothetical protein
MGKEAVGYRDSETAVRIERFYQDTEEMQVPTNQESRATDRHFGQGSSNCA